MRTACRNHEVRAMKWSQIDFSRRVWTIPAEVAKAGRAHQVPLAPGAWQTIERRHKLYGDQGPFVFSGGKRCNNCREVGHIGVPLGRTMDRISIKAGLVKNVGTAEEPRWEGENIRFHDIRRTVADRLLNILGIDLPVVDQGVLGHAAGQLVKTYCPSGIALTKVAAALSAWDAHLTALLSGEQRRRATVSAISKGRRA
jgi:integrase